MIDFKEEDSRDKISELRERESEDLAQILATKYGLPYMDLSRVSINTDALRLIDEVRSREGNIVAFSFKGESLNVAVLSPHKELAKTILDELGKEYKINLYMASPKGMDRVWQRYKEISKAKTSKGGQIDISDEALAEYMKVIKSADDVNRLAKENFTEASTISNILEVIIAGALALEASDIHIEPEETLVRVRYRIDGVLQEIYSFDPKTYRLLSSRIKLISALKLNVSSTRQDGRFSIKVDKESVEVRTSVIPGAYGESFVLRILNPDAISVPFEALGMSEHLLEVVREEIEKPHGMILTTGPTGSGKTTTLYAFLRHSNKPGIKIITIEDPIEYHLPGIVQTQVKGSDDKGSIILKSASEADDAKTYTFAEGLKSAMRQDPDIILVGEIRDAETAGTAVDASLTGHLVYSTLHTNNAAGAIPRLLDLEVNPKVIGAALNLAMAQRLVRKICDNCKKEVEPNEEERKVIEKHLKIIRDRGMEAPELGKLTKASGCEKCGNTGYKGRIGIFEAVRMDEAVEDMVNENPSEFDILKAAEPQKILSMTQDGIIKVLAGVTTLEELERVVVL